MPASAVPATEALTPPLKWAGAKTKIVARILAHLLRQALAPGAGVLDPRRQPGADAALLRGCAGGNLFHADFAACDAYRGLEAAAPDVACPVTLVLGARDQMTSPKAVAPIVQALSPKVVTLAMGHNLMAEDPDGVLNALTHALQP